jgi:hypothetical protein
MRIGRCCTKGVIPGSPEGRDPESMNTGLWKMDSGLAATRRPGMTMSGSKQTVRSASQREL